MLIPKNRHEYYLAVISGNDYPTFLPKIREEQYLAKLAGREVDVSNPKTPKERAYFNIINDIKFEPENRWQTFVAAANDDSITSPVPITREEIWWANISLSHEVIVEYTGTLPATLQTVEGYLESYKIYGNTVQNGTPTPDSPITPQGTGERTGNLFDVDARDTNNGYVNNMQLNQDGTMTSWPTSEITEYIELTPNATYTLTNIGSYNSLAYCIYDNDRQYITGVMYRGQSTKVINMPPNGKYLRFTHVKTKPDTMLNTGSTPLPYEPYGYKLPLTVNGVEYPIYLGQVETTRQIKKLVLTGEEVFIQSNTSNHYRVRTTVSPKTIGYGINGMVCTHYNPSNSSQGNSVSTSSDGGTLYFYDDINATTTTNFKQYLNDQYAAGTPVTIWYILAEPETAVVNESLMTIGDYADTIDSTQTSVQIPTAAGTTVIDYAGEGLAPSKVELTYKTIKKTYVSADDKVYQDTNGQLLGG